MARAASICTLIFCLHGAGCASTFERMPVPSAQAEAHARLPKMTNVRMWADETPTNLKAMFQDRLSHQKPLGASAEVVKGRLQIEILALSGGGPDGAFGAGVLAGWTARGDRPEFEHVTGVSAGAIIAPFAFLGPEYDATLREIWTSYNTEQLATPNILGGLLGGAALADTSPMKALIAKYVDREFLKRIAAEYNRGRMLTVGTTNLDAKRPVVWNMGEIAIHDTPEAVQLFRDVILASAAIPGLFPPVRIEVIVDGKRYDELHVDGGVTRQIYVTPVNLPLRAFDALYAKPPQRRIFLIQNGKMQPDYGAVKPATLEIAKESISTLLLYQHKGDNYRIYRQARDAGAEFNTISVPETFNVAAKEKFDIAYQRALYEEGYRLGQSGAWRKAPLDVPTEEAQSGNSRPAPTSGRPPSANTASPRSPPSPAGAQRELTSATASTGP